jgi:hypothetical protein
VEVVDNWEIKYKSSAERADDVGTKKLMYALAMTEF